MKSQKSTVVEFIAKLLEIMEKYPEIARWSEDGTQFVLYSRDQFSERVLPDVFRHNKFQSFVRQLNMYGFHKVCRHKDSVNFRHQLFFKGNQKNFCLIKRKKKQALNENQQKGSMDQEIQERYSQHLHSTTPIAAPVLLQIVKFKNKVSLQILKMKKMLDYLNREVSTKKSRQIKPTLSKIKQAMAIVEENALKSEHELQKLKENLKYQEETQNQKIPNSADTMATTILSTSLPCQPPFMSMSNFANISSGVRGLNSVFSLHSVTNFIS